MVHNVVEGIVILFFKVELKKDWIHLDVYIFILFISKHDSTGDKHGSIIRHHEWPESDRYTNRYDFIIRIQIIDGYFAVYIIL